jgi:hypothetical protein
MRLLCAAVMLAVSLAMSLAMSWAAAAADCTCRSQGRDYPLGQSVCLQSPKGARIATCGMVLNNTSWQFTETPCVISQALPDEPSAPGAAAHGHGHGAQATLVQVPRAAP